MSVAYNQEHLWLLHELGIRSAILIPLLSRDTIYGVLTLVLSNSGKLFDENDLEFAKELARRATLAIENAKLFKGCRIVTQNLSIELHNVPQNLKLLTKSLKPFSYSVSHDLRAPLRSIDGFSNKILKDYSNLFDDQGKDYFNRVMNASRHMGRLIDDLLKLARISRIDMNMKK